MMNTAGILNNFQNFPPQSSTLSVTVTVFDREWTSFGYCAV